MTLLLSVQGISKSYPSRRLFDDLSLDLRAGDFELCDQQAFVQVLWEDERERIRRESCA